MQRLDLAPLAPHVQELLQHIGAEADKAGVRIFIVGGVVRDLLLGVPVSDIDIVLEGDAPAFARRLAGQLSAAVRVHTPFRTAVLTFKDGLSLDLVTARRESYARPGALPDIVPGTMDDDLFRRDFTVNALACGLNADNRGVVRDDLEGLTDLEARLIRTTYPESFRDDPTRIVRAARYAARFGFQLDALTQEALEAAVGAGAMTTITPVRYFLELGRILDEKDPVPALDLLSLWGAVRYVSYEAEDRALLVLCGAAREERMAALVHGLPPGKIDAVLTAFNLSRTAKRAIAQCLRHQP